MPLIRFLATACPPAPRTRPQFAAGHCPDCFDLRVVTRIVCGEPERVPCPRCGSTATVEG